MTEPHVVVDGDTVYVQCSKTQWLNVIALLGDITHQNCTASLYMSTPRDIRDKAYILSNTVTAHQRSGGGYNLTFSGDVKK